MPRCLALLLAGTLACALSTPQPSVADVAHAVGIARDATNQQLRYIEHHQYLPSGEHRVKYFDHTGEVLVTKSLTYPDLPQHPEITQTEPASNLKVTTRNQGSTMQQVVQRKGQTETLEVPLDTKTIIDAGFDTFIRAQWQSFEENVPKIYNLAVVGEKRLLKVAITKQPNDGTNTPFTVEPTNFFLRLLVPKMHLHYDSKRRLSGYVGPTNLNLPKGNDGKVSIEFTHYTSTEPLANPQAAWLPEA